MKQSNNVNFPFKGLNPEDIKEALEAGFSTAEGTGVPFGDRVEVVREVATPKLEEEEPDPVINKDALSVRAFVKNQREKYPHTHHFKRMEVKVLDLSVPEDLEELGEIYTNSRNVDYGLTLLNDEYMFSKLTDNWKVLLTLEHSVFENVVLEKK